MSSSLSEYKVSSESASRPAVTAPARRGCGRSADGTAFPADAPYRSLYVGARATGVLLAVTLIALSAMAVALADLPGKWLSAMLSPCINSLVAHTTCLCCILLSSRRYRPVVRFFWDGALAIGLAIAGGFLTSFTVNQVRNGRGTADSAVDPLVLGAVIVAGVFSASLVHLGISLGGLQDWRRLRAVARAEGA